MSNSAGADFSRQACERKLCRASRLQINCSSSAARRRVSPAPAFRESSANFIEGGNRAAAGFAELSPRADRGVRVDLGEWRPPTLINSKGPREYKCIARSAAPTQINHPICALGSVQVINRNNHQRKRGKGCR